MNEANDCRLFEHIMASNRCDYMVCRHENRCLCWEDFREAQERRVAAMFSEQEIRA